MADVMDNVYQNLIQTGMNFRPIAAWQEGKEEALQRENQQTILGLKKRAIELDQETLDLHGKIADETAWYHKQDVKLRESGQVTEADLAKRRIESNEKIARLYTQSDERKIQSENTKMKIALMTADRYALTDLGATYRNAVTTYERFASSAEAQYNPTLLEEMKGNVDALGKAYFEQAKIRKESSGVAPEAGPGRQGTGNIYESIFNTGHQEAVVRDEKINDSKSILDRTGLIFYQTSNPESMIRKPDGSVSYDPAPARDARKKNGIEKAQAIASKYRVQLDAVRNKYEKDLETNPDATLDINKIDLIRRSYKQDLKKLVDGDQHLNGLIPTDF